MKTRIKLVSFIPSPALTLFKESRLSTGSRKVKSKQASKKDIQKEIYKKYRRKGITAAKGAEVIRQR